MSSLRSQPMSILVLVRHGQASVTGDEYDRLSPRGEEQARRLGAYWRRLGARVDRVFVGPRRRHRHSCDLALASFGRVAEPVELAGLDEHSGQHLFLGSGTDLHGERLRDHLRRFRDTSRQWVRGEVATPEGAESWVAFRRRVAAALEAMTTGLEPGEVVVAFTSGGPVAAAVGQVLGLEDEAVLELSWSVRNVAMSELRYAPGRLTLLSHNALPHLRDPELVTFI